MVKKSDKLNKQDNDFYNPEPTKDEIEVLERKLQNFPQSRVNGRLQSPSYLYMKTIGVISFDEFGNPIIHNPSEYSRIEKMAGILTHRKMALEEAYMKAHPEEMQASLDRMRNALKNKFQINHTPTELDL